MKKYTFIFFVIVFISGCNKDTTVNEILTYVNPFIGTSGHGHTFPGAAYPFGMVQLSPDTGLEGWEWCSGYHYSDSSIMGFSHTHLSGTGRSDLMDVMLMPTIGKIKLQAGTKEDPDGGYRSRFSHDEEWASPGYYKVNLKDYNVIAELTVSARCGFHKYTFPESKDSHIILDLSHHYTKDSVIFTSLNLIDSCTITRQRSTKGWGESGEEYWSNQQLFYAVRVSKPFLSANVALDDNFIKERATQGKNVKAVLNFETKKDEEILVKVGISAICIENTLLNLSEEIPEWDFDLVLNNTRSAWQGELSKIKIAAPEKMKTVFYTALYHSLLAPYLYNDVNGEYLGYDKKVHKAENFNNYTVLSLWDTFQAENPLLTLLAPDRTNDLIQSMLIYEQYGLLPVWSLWSSETNCIIGYHSVPVIVDTYFKGIRGYDVEKAYQAMKTSAMQDKRGGEHQAIIPNEKFPDMKALADYVHGKGLKIGIYSSPWVQTFAGFAGGGANTREGEVINPSRRYGEFSFAKNDVQQWAEWGFDYVKYDWVTNDIAHTAELTYLLRQSGHDIVYSISNAAPFELAEDWKNLTNTRRTTGDIHDSWYSLTTIGFLQDKWQPFACPGSWNGPDMLIVGKVGWGKDLHNTQLTPDEQYLHMSLWSILAAPLLIGCDMREMDTFTLNVLSNREVIEVNQDIADIQGKRVRADGNRQIEIWSRPLSDGLVAVGLSNLSDNDAGNRGYVERTESEWQAISTRPVEAKRYRRF